MYGGQGQTKSNDSAGNALHEVSDKVKSTFGGDSKVTQ